MSCICTPSGCACDYSPPWMAAGRATPLAVVPDPRWGSGLGNTPEELWERLQIMLEELRRREAAGIQPPPRGWLPDAPNNPAGGAAGPDFWRHWREVVRDWTDDIARRGPPRLPPGARPPGGVGMLPPSEEAINFLQCEAMKDAAQATGRGAADAAEAAAEDARAAAGEARDLAKETPSAACAAALNRLADALDQLAGQADAATSSASAAAAAAQNSDCGGPNGNPTFGGNPFAGAPGELAVMRAALAQALEAGAIASRVVNQIADLKQQIQDVAAGCGLTDAYLSRHPIPYA